MTAAMLESVLCSSAWSDGIKSANSMSSRALNTSDAEMLLCCLEVETSCALIIVYHVGSGQKACDAFRAL